MRLIEIEQKVQGGKCEACAGTGHRRLCFEQVTCVACGGTGNVVVANAYSVLTRHSFRRAEFMSHARQSGWKRHAGHDAALPATTQRVNKPFGL